MIDTITILTTKGDLLATKVVSWSQVANAPQTQGYGNAKRFSGKEVPVNGIDELSALMAKQQAASQSFVIRGAIAPGADRQNMLRRVIDRPDAPATIIPAARHWVALDIDSLPCPDSIDPVHDIDEVVEFVVGHLPPEFEGASCHWALTSSAGIKPGIRLRLWFWFDRPLEDWQLKTWLDGYPVDHSVFAPAQPIYTAAPIFKGMADPCPRRCGLWRGNRDEVTPPVIERVKRTYSGASAGAGGGSGGSGYAHHRARIGDHEGGGGFLAPIKSAVAAWWAANGSSADPSWLRADLERAIRDAERTEGKHPDSYVETRVADLDPLIAAIRQLQAAKEADRPAPEPVAPTYSDADHVSVEEGERLMSEFGAKFLAKVRGWNNWPGEQIKPAQRETVRFSAFGYDLNIEPPEPRPPVELIIATLGLGKTELICGICAEVPEGENVTCYARDHSLVAELADRIRARGGEKHRVIPFYGREQDHPDGGPMCYFADLARDISKTGQSVERALCKRPKDPETMSADMYSGRSMSLHEYCPRHPDINEVGCRYETQRGDTGPAIRVAPHAYLAIGDGNPLPDAALSLIDEAPAPALIRDGNSYGVPLRLITQIDWLGTGKKEHAADDAQTAMDYSRALHDVLAAPASTPAKLRAAGLDAGKAKWMAGRWFEQVEDLGVTPAMPRSKKEERIKAYKSQISLQMGRLWTLVHDVIDLDTDELRCFRIVEVMHKHPETMVLMVWSVEPKITGPVLICDGTADDEITRRFFPDVEVTTINVRAENYFAVQVTDRAVSKTMLGYGLGDMLENPRADEVRRAKNRRADLARLAECVAAEYGGPVPVMTYMRVAEAMRAEHRGLVSLGVEVGFQRADGKWAGHHGAERGTDRYRRAPVGVIGGCHLPPRDDLERTARAVFYKDPRPMTYQGPGLYDMEQRAIRMADGTGHPVMNKTHPDPLIRRLLDQSIRATAEQEAHRLRLIRRTAEDAPTLIVGTNAVLNLTVHRAVTWDALIPNHAQVLLARGVVPADWPGRALVVADMLEGDDHAHALRQAAQRNPAAWAAVECVTNPNKARTNERFGFVP